jgi:hypothetical protein
MIQNLRWYSGVIFHYVIEVKSCHFTLPWVTVNRFISETFVRKMYVSVNGVAISQVSASWDVNQELLLHVVRFEGEKYKS